MQIRMECIYSLFGCYKPKDNALVNPVVLACIKIDELRLVTMDLSLSILRLETHMVKIQNTKTYIQNGTIIFSKHNALVDIRGYKLYNLDTILEETLQDIQSF
jgi:hypothetical protein